MARPVRPRSLTPGRTAGALAALGVAVATWSLMLLPVRASHGARTTGDEPQYLLTALSLGEDASLDIADERAAGRYRAFHEAPLPIQEADRPDGRRLSPHNLGLPALLALPVRVGGWVGAKAALAALAGALAALMAWTAHHRFGVRLGSASLGAAAFAGSPPLAVYATQIYPELPAALAVTAATAALTGRLRTGGLVAAGAAVAALPWLSVKYLPVAAVLAVLTAARLRTLGRLRPLGVLLGAWSIIGVAYVAVHVGVYEGLTPYAAGAHFVAGEATVMGRDPDLLGRSLRVPALLLDAGFGLVPWAPLYLLLPGALGALLVRRPPGWPALAAPLAAGWAGATWLALTMHGWWWPGRQVVVVLPLAALAVVWWVDGEPRLRVAAGVAAVVGWATTLWLALDGLGRGLAPIVDVDRLGAPAARLLRPLLPDLRRWAVPDRVSLAAWTAALVASVIAAARAARRETSGATGSVRPAAGRAASVAVGRRRWRMVP
jgi:hypothetical protein